jgi:hypothetical protein
MNSFVDCNEPFLFWSHHRITSFTPQGANNFFKIGKVNCRVFSIRHHAILLTSSIACPVRWTGRKKGEKFMKLFINEKGCDAMFLFPLRMKKKGSSFPLLILDHVWRAAWSHFHHWVGIDSDLWPLEERNFYEYFDKRGGVECKWFRYIVHFLDEMSASLILSDHSSSEFEETWQESCSPTSSLSFDISLQKNVRNVMERIRTFRSAIQSFDQVQLRVRVFLKL